METHYRIEAANLGATIVPMPGVTLDTVGVVRDRLVGRFGEETVSKALPIYVFQRYQWVLDRVRGSSFLDVGYSHGVMLDAAIVEDRFDRIAGVEVKEGWLAEEGHPWEAHITDGGRLPFDDDTFDSVSCQEVIEHLDDPAALVAELRRVARQVLITTPLCQKGRLPLGGHIQRYCADRLRAMFPTARFTALDKGNGRYPWVLIEE